jgi:hypothetical protein
MQKRSGLLFLSKKTKRIFLILENSKWTVPTFSRKSTLIEDSQELLDKFSHGKLLPIELYLSEDKGFEYGTYICLVDKEFLPESVSTFCWGEIDNLPGNLHNGLRSTLNNSLIKTKIKTVLELETWN